MRSACWVGNYFSFRIMREKQSSRHYIRILTNIRRKFEIFVEWKVFAPIFSEIFSIHHVTTKNTSVRNNITAALNISSNNNDFHCKTLRINSNASIMVRVGKPYAFLATDSSKRALRFCSPQNWNALVLLTRSIYVSDRFTYIINLTFFFFNVKKITLLISISLV